MTTSAVSQINLFGNAQGTASNVKNGQSDSFSEIFAAQAENKAEANVAAKPEESRKVNDSEDLNQTNASEETNDVQEATKEKTDEIDMEKTDKVLSEEEVEEAAEELLTKVAQVMNVTPQDIENALKELGLTAKDLLNTDNIGALVVALTEGADELSVMTNEELFANVQEITAKAEELLAGLSETSGMNFAEIQEAMAKMAEHNPVAKEDVVLTSANPSDAVTTDELAVTLENANATEVQATSKETSRDNRQGAANDNANNQQMTFAQTVAERLEQAVAKTDSVTTSYTTTTESIMNQIQDGIRVIQSQDMTEMELQLHPASLGNLRIQIAAKEGVVTAVFTTENEAVRAALESQLVTLKENFAQQGVRVEAVEVTVASHAFEQNLNGDESHAGEQAPEKKSTSRRITLSDLTADDLEEELSDEDRIVAEMMRENGNTVDYTV